jgi:hypothetical protein
LCPILPAYEQTDDPVVGEVTWRFPIAFSDEELHGLEPLLPLGIDSARR